MIRSIISRWFNAAPVASSPLPPHVANLRLNMDLIYLHMSDAHRPDDRTKVGYVPQAPDKESKK